MESHHNHRPHSDVDITELYNGFEDFSIQKSSEMPEVNCNICYNLMVEPCNLQPYCAHKYCI